MSNFPTEFLLAVALDSTQDYESRQEAAFGLLDLNRLDDAVTLLRNLDDMAVDESSLSDGFKIFVSVAKDLARNGNADLLLPLAGDLSVSQLGRESIAECLGTFNHKAQAVDILRRLVEEETVDAGALYMALNALIAFGQSRVAEPKLRALAENSSVEGWIRKKARARLEELEGGSPVTPGRPELTPGQRGINDAYEAFQSANTFGEMEQAVARFPPMTSPYFISQVERIIAEEVPEREMPKFRQRLDWLRHVPPDPAQLVIQAFAATASFEDMKKAVEQYPVMTDPEFIRHMERIIPEQVSSDLQPAFRQRLMWLRKFPADSFQLAMDAVLHASSVEEMREVVKRYPFLAKRSTIEDMMRHLDDFSDDHRDLFMQRIEWLRQMPRGKSEELIEQARERYEQGRFPDALGLLNRALKAAPDAFEAYLWRGIIYMSLEDDEKAVADFTRYIERKPDSSLAYERRGKSQAHLGRDREAIKDFTRAIELDPDNEDAYTGRGLSYMRIEQLDRALADFNHLIELGSDNWLVYECRANILVREARFEEALRDVDRAIELEPMVERPYITKGVILIELKKYHEAFPWLEKGRELGSEQAAMLLEMFAHKFTGPAAERAEGEFSDEDAEYWADEAFRLVQSGRVEEAIESLDRSLEINPFQPKTLSNRAIFLTTLGRMDEALDSHERALRIDPNDPQLLFNKAYTLSSMERYEEALAYYDRAINLSPRVTLYWLNRGATLVSLNRYDEAIGSFDRALALEPSNAEAVSEKGAALGHAGRYTEALDCLERALEMDPSEPMAWFHKGVVLYEMERMEAAAYCLEHAERVNPHIQPLIENYRRKIHERGYAVSYDSIEEAQYCFDKGGEALAADDFEKAAEYLDRLIELAPQSPAAWHNRGVVWLNTDRPEMALDCFERSIELSGSAEFLAMAWFNKGSALWQLMRLDEAADCFKKTLNINPGHQQALRSLDLLRQLIGENAFEDEENEAT